jgi:hypothetical protein
VRLVELTLIQHDWGFYKKRKFEHRHRWRKDDHPPAKERDLEHSLPSQPSGGTNPFRCPDLELVASRTVRKYISIA